MASTFSPSLRIELIGAGEQAGTWGSTTNTNLGTLIEDAISGYAAVTISSAAQALTANNGSADQSRNAVLQLNSAAQAFAIYAPPESKQYTVFNNTSYTATIYNSTALGNTTAAGNGVAIPAGKTVTVWSDGTDFAVQNNVLIGDVTGNVTGVITATAGSTATTQTFGTSNTTMATTAFVQAALQALHPVGSVYINATNNTNPGTLLGFGTWTAFGAGRVPVGFNAADPLFDTAEETGGSKDAIVVSHTHTYSSTTGSAGSASGTILARVGSDFGSFQSDSGTGVFAASGGSLPNRMQGTAGGGSRESVTMTIPDHTHSVSGTTASAGSSGTNGNLQPYITVYMWKRTA